MLKSRTSINPNDGILVEVASNGLNTVNSLVKARLFQHLFSLSRKHIEEGKRQMVVFSFDFIGHHINLDGGFEKGELDTFFGWMSTRREVFDGVAIDVGANIGNHSLYFSDFYYKVYSFEPNPRTYQVLKLNADLATNVVCYDFGISDVERDASLNIYANNIGHSNISDDPGESTKRIKLRTLDGFIKADEKVRLIKFDIEGHEYQAIQGSLATIKRNKPVILFEQFSAEIDNGTSRVIELLRTCGYRKFASVSKTTKQLRSSNKFINGLLAILNKLPIAKSILFGTVWSVRIQQEFARADYPFIVAIPEWLNIEAG